MRGTEFNIKKRIMEKNNSSKGLIIIGLIMIILQGANLVGVAVNRVDIVNNAEKLDLVYKDYVPMWFLEGMQKNNDYKTEEIIATLSGDKEQVKKINTKYIEFQNIMMNNLIKMRGGRTMVTRSGKINVEQ